MCLATLLQSCKENGNEEMDPVVPPGRVIISPGTDLLSTGHKDMRNAHVLNA